MKRDFNILIIAIALTIGCTSKRADSKQIKNCSFEFEIDQESSMAYKYNSKTGRLSKLIDPFKEKPLYADTVLRISNEQLCKLMTMYVEYKISDYPDQFKPASKGIVIVPEPAYQLKFKYKDKIKEINWTSNTCISATEEAIHLNEIIRIIDSLILSTPEFKALPEGQYEWL